MTVTTPSDELGQALGTSAAQVALSCRILARAGLASGSLGHVSVRTGEDTLLIRCRSSRDTGLLHTTADDVRATSLSRPGLDGDGDGDHRLPHELPIHTELYRARPEIGSVVHVHAPAAVLCGLAGLELRPVFGAFDIPAARLATTGVPVFPRAALVSRAELARDLVAAMSGHDACLMRGHGITVTGTTVVAATVRALTLELLARVTVELHRLGADAPELDTADLAELPDLGPAFNDDLVWRHHAEIDRRTVGPTAR